MALATWWGSDPLPHLPALTGFEATLPLGDVDLVRLNRLSLAEVQARRQGGHRPYLGLLQGTPVAYGWVATREASIGELGLTFRLPPGNRYLWDFATLPGFQGRGIYPRLLRAILVQESSGAERFWIIHAPENVPSGAGMHKAGLVPIGRLSFRLDGGVGLAPLGSPERASGCAPVRGTARRDRAGTLLVLRVPHPTIGQSHRGGIVLAATGASHGPMYVRHRTETASRAGGMSMRDSSTGSMVGNCRKRGFLLACSPTLETVASWPTSVWFTSICMVG